MTRSLGDFYMQHHGATWEPAVSCIDLFDLVDQLDHITLILASDGLWDFATHEKAADLVCRAKSAQAAADRLTRFTSNESNSKFGRLKDDTTVVVVELDFRDAAARGTAPTPPRRKSTCSVQ